MKANSKQVERVERLSNSIGWTLERAGRPASKIMNLVVLTLQAHGLDLGTHFEPMFEIAVNAYNESKNQTV